MVLWDERPGPGVAYGVFSDSVGNICTVGDRHLQGTPTAWSARIRGDTGISWGKTHDPSGVGVSQLRGGLFDPDSVSFIAVDGVERTNDARNPYLAHFTPRAGRTTHAARIGIGTPSRLGWPRTRASSSSAVDC